MSDEGRPLTPVVSESGEIAYYEVKTNGDSFMAAFAQAQAQNEALQGLTRSQAAELVAGPAQGDASRVLAVPGNAGDPAARAQAVSPRRRL